jgi:hypothetical protein
MKASCYKFFVWFWRCNDWRNIVGMCGVLDVVVPGVWEVVPREDVCVVGVINLVETAVVEVIPPVFSVDVEELDGCLVSV